MMSYQEGSPPEVLVYPFHIYTVYKLLYTKAPSCHNSSQWSFS